MSRDYTADIDRLGKQFAELRAVLTRQTGPAADDAASYLVPRAQRFARKFQHEGRSLSKSALRNPSAATGAVIGAIALGALLAMMLSGGDSRKDPE